ncbi:MAG TPA: HDOD domain-containing protein [Terriglobales bacterium]|nr:HDOD domain-containing protein [Terriglobales bacterium]
MADDVFSFDGFADPVSASMPIRVSTSRKQASLMQGESMGIVSASPLGPVEPVKTLPPMENLPPFPAVAMRALNVLAGTETSLRELCEVIRPDPVFSAEVLRLANSPLVAFSKEVSNVLQASMLLGFRRLRRLVITVGLRSYLDNASAQLLRSCWRHSVACAMLAERTARWNSVDRDFAYTSGILHDIGRVVLATMGPDSYASLLARIPDHPGEMLRCEQDMFGIDHCQAGARLVSAWHLPEEFVAITARHHDPLTHAEDAPEVTRLACRLADALGFSVSPQGSPYSAEEVLAEFPENVRTHLPQVREMAAEIAREIDVIDATVA